MHTYLVCNSFKLHRGATNSIIHRSAPVSATRSRPSVFTAKLAFMESTQDLKWVWAVLCMSRRK